MEPWKWLRCHGFPLHHCGRQKSEIGLTGLKSGCGPSGSSSRECVSSPFPASRGCLQSVAHALSSTVKAAMASLTSASVVMAPSLTLLPPSYKNPCDDTGLMQIIQDNVPTSRYLVQSAKFLFPGKVT